MARKCGKHRGARRQQPGSLDGGYYLQIITDVSVAAGLNPSEVALLPIPVFRALQKSLEKKAEQMNSSNG